MNSTTHSICAACWKEKSPSETPLKMYVTELEKCCYCGALSKSGIYVTDEPENCLCKGVHSTEKV
jgi:hypothetical protein